MVDILGHPWCDLPWGNHQRTNNSRGLGLAMRSMADALTEKLFLLDDPNVNLRFMRA